MNKDAEKWIKEWQLKLRNGPVSTEDKFREAMEWAYRDAMRICDEQSQYGDMDERGAGIESGCNSVKEAIEARLK